MGPVVRPKGCGHCPHPVHARSLDQVRSLVERLYANYMGTVEQALKQRGLLAGDGVLLAIFAALDGACSSS
jgi:hypothetical protein